MAEPGAAPVGEARILPLGLLLARPPATTGRPQGACRRGRQCPAERGPELTTVEAVVRAAVERRGASVLRQGRGTASQAIPGAPADALNGAAPKPPAAGSALRSPRTACGIDDGEQADDGVPGAANNTGGEAWPHATFSDSKQIEAYSQPRHSRGQHQDAVANYFRSSPRKRGPRILQARVRSSGFPLSRERTALGCARTLYQLSQILTGRRAIDQRCRELSAHPLPVGERVGVRGFFCRLFD